MYGLKPVPFIGLSSSAPCKAFFFGCACGHDGKACPRSLSVIAILGEQRVLLAQQRGTGSVCWSPASSTTSCLRAVILVWKGVISPILCGLQRPSGSEQLQQVADRAHQSPLVAKILLAAQAEAAEAASLLDLSEDRFNDRLAHLVDRASGLGPQLMSHLFPWSRTSGRFARCRLCRIAMFIAARRDV